MWVLQEDWLVNLRHAVEVALEGPCIRIGFLDGSGGKMEFPSEAEAKRFFRVLVLRLGRLDGVLVAEGVKDARQD
jgi:hypothetical protein